MDELQILRAFRAGVRAPGAAERDRALGQLAAALESASRRRRRRRQVGAVALAAVALALALALLPGRIGRDRDVVERAGAGLPSGPVLHAVLEVPLRAVIDSPVPVRVTNVDLRTGVETPVVARTELWYDARQRRLHQLESINGAVVADSLQTRHGTVRSSGAGDSDPPTIDPGLGGFFEGYGRALEDGTVKVRGTGIVRGRRVRWLRFPPRPGPYAEDVAVDVKTERPVLLRQGCPGCAGQTTYRIATLQAVREDAADFSRPVRRDLHRVGRARIVEKNVSLRVAASALGGRTLWPGRALGSLRLTAVQLSKVTVRLAPPEPSTARTVRRTGLTFFYGGRLNRWGRVRVRRGEPYVTIGAATAAGVRFDGFDIDVESGSAVGSFWHSGLPAAGHALMTQSRGASYLLQLHTRGRYIEIQSSSRALALAAARALEQLSRRS
jgi:hypothetical protein